MATTTLNMQILLRKDDVFTSTYVLAAGEPGFEISTNTLKIGDGTKTWAELSIANKEAIDALIKVVDDKVKALGDTYATDDELAAGLALKADLATYNAYVEAHANDYTNTQIDEAVAGAKTHAETKISDFKTNTFDPVAADVATIKGDYTTAAQAGTIAQGKVDDFNTATIAPLSERVTAAENTLKTHGDIVTHNAADFEAAGAAAAVEGRVNETLKSYYTKTEADAAFTTPAEVISEVNKALAEVSDADSITNITTLVNYANEQGADLTALITEVYGSAEITGNSRLDDIEATVDTNKATWDKAGTALQAADLADYAKTDDVVTNDEFTQFETANTAAINAKLDKSIFDAFNNGTAKSISELEQSTKDYTDTKISGYTNVNDDITIEGKSISLNTDGNDDVTINGRAVITNEEFGYTFTRDTSTQELQTIDVQIKGQHYQEDEAFPDLAYTNGLSIGQDFATLHAGDTLEDVHYSAVSVDSSSVDIHGAQRVSIDIAGEGYENCSSILLDNSTFAAHACPGDITDLSGDMSLTTDTFDVTLTAEDGSTNKLDFTADGLKINSKQVATEEYVDAQIGEKAGVTAITAGTDIVVDKSTGAVTISHKTYATGKATLDTTPDEPYFFNALDLENGHVTKAYAQSLKAALEGMTFVLDGGTSSSN